MKKLILGVAATVAMLFAVNASAQQNFGSAGVELALPMGDFADFANFGYGVSLQYEYGLTDNLALNLNAGVLLYSIETDGFSFTHIPIQVGGRYYFTEQRDGLFAGVRLGIHLAMSKMDDIEILGQTIKGTSDTNANFSFAPEVGYFVNENISLALRYQIVTPNGDQEGAKSLSYLGLRAAYNF